MVITAEQVKLALEDHCGLCHAVPDQPCRNFITGEPLPDGQLHFYRLKTI
jgi:hypothetical protein